jgi:TRAP-type C4-dicarboxylate transport system substrate-binding protein
MQKKISISGRALLIMVLLALLVVSCAPSSPSGTPTSADLNPTAVNLGSTSTPEATATPRIFELKFALPAPETSAYVTNGYIPWAKSIVDATGGTIKLTFTFSDTSVAASKTWEAVNADDTDLGYLQTGLYPDKFLIEGMVGLPGLGIESSAQAARILNQLADKYPQQIIKEYGRVKVLHYYSSTPNVLITNKPIRTLDDLKGLKIMAEDQNDADALTALGATSVVLQPTDVSLKFTNNEIDGALCDWQEIADNSLSNKATYFTEIGLSVKPYSTLINQDMWNLLPAGPQIKIKGLVGLDGSLIIAKQGFDDGSSAIQKQIAAMDGKTVGQLSPDDMAKMVAATESVRTKYIAFVTDKGFPGKEIYDEILKLIPETK